MNETRIAILIAALISCGGSVAFARTPAERHPITLNRAAFDYARELIAHGRLVADKKGSWRKHHPSRSEENEFIHNHGFQEYAKWHLGIDRTQRRNKRALQIPVWRFRSTPPLW